MRVSTIALGVFACISPGGPVLAAEFTCTGLVLTRTVPGAKAAGQHAFSSQAQLHLSIDETRPDRSSMRWTGDPTMEGLSSSWPPNTQLIIEQGIIAASFAASKDGVSSVGSLTIDAGGAFRTTESALLPKGVLFDVLEGACRKDSE